MDEQLVTAALSKQPHFTIEKFERGEGLWNWGEVVRLIGSASESLPTENQSVCLYFLNNEFASGVLLESEGDTWYRTIQVGMVDFERFSDSLRLGTLLAIFPYDRRRLDLVVDPELRWQEVTYSPHLAFTQQVVGADVKSYKQLTPYNEGDPLPPGATIEEGGWDHEHCVFCWGKIDAEHNGYNSEPDNQGEWVCKWRYQNGVMKHDLRAFWIPYEARES
jgi:hypothetical protein